MELAEGSAIRYRRLGGIVSEIRLTVMPENLIDCNRGLMGQNALVLRGGGNFLSSNNFEICTQFQSK